MSAELLSPEAGVPLEYQDPENLSSKEEEHYRNFLVVGHTYQPHRTPLLPTSGDRLDMVGFVNDRINAEVYKPIFEDTDKIPDTVFSYYAPLRDWKKQHTPEGYETAVEHINAIPNKEYQVLGDPYMHVIMPLQSEEDQDMLVKIGKRAFKDDLGFEPKGFWPPETAIDATTARVLFQNGYEFVVLRNDQVDNHDQNPVRVPIREDDGTEIGELAVVHFNSGLSGDVSYQDRYTENGDRFLAEQSYWNPDDVSIGSDMELYGHHKRDRDKFLEYVTQASTLQRYGYQALDVKDALQNAPQQSAEIWDRSSWSCPHGLGRWTGECDCDHPNAEALHDKQEFYKKLTDYGTVINISLDVLDENWREKFVPFFIGVRQSWFEEGDINADIQAMIAEDREGLSILQNDEVRRHFMAKMCELVGKTSCGWFFPGTNSPERELPRSMISEIETLLPGIESIHTEDDEEYAIAA